MSLPTRSMRSQRGFMLPFYGIILAVCAIGSMDPGEDMIDCKKTPAACNFKAKEGSVPGVMLQDYSDGRYGHAAPAIVGEGVEPRESASLVGVP